MMNADYIHARLLDLLPRFIKRGNGYDRCSICNQYNQSGSIIPHFDDCLVKDVHRIAPGRTKPKATIKLMSEREYFKVKLMRSQDDK